MRLHSHPWSIDAVAVLASGLLLMGSACALAAVWLQLAH
jgi:hypothetical protein